MKVTRIPNMWLLNYEQVGTAQQSMKDTQPLLTSKALTESPVDPLLNLRITQHCTLFANVQGCIVT